MLDTVLEDSVRQHNPALADELLRLTQLGFNVDDVGIAICLTKSTADKHYILIELLDASFDRLFANVTVQRLPTHSHVIDRTVTNHRQLVEFINKY